MTGTITTWISGSIGDWFDSNNWVSGTVPQAGDTAVISAGTPKIDSGGQILGETITLGDGRVIDVLYSGVASAGTVTIDGTLNVSNGGVAQEFEVASGGIAVVLAWRSQRHAGR
jgi:autotransporter passenger strand-loop-strand repeat protein